MVSVSEAAGQQITFEELAAVFESSFQSELCSGCGHYDACRGGCMAAKFFTGLPMDGPDPECVEGYGLSALSADREIPRPRVDHSRPVLLTLAKPPTRLCNESPL